MHILLADDDSVIRALLSALLTREGHSVDLAVDGDAAWAALQAPEPPPLVMLDWFMPGVDGLELCRRIRADARLRSTYVIVCTTQHQQADIVRGLDAGADDYVTKPFDARELCARIRAGERVLDLQAQLSQRVRELEVALAEIKQLQGFLPICCYCKNIRDDQNYWQQVEIYLEKRSALRFSHGICPGCYNREIQPQLDALDLADALPRNGCSAPTKLTCSGA